MSAPVASAGPSAAGGDAPGELRVGRGTFDAIQRAGRARSPWIAPASAPVTATAVRSPPPWSTAVVNASTGFVRGRREPQRQRRGRPRRAAGPSSSHCDHRSRAPSSSVRTGRWSSDSTTCRSSGHGVGAVRPLDERGDDAGERGADATARLEAWVTAASSDAANPTEAGAPGVDGADRDRAGQRGVTERSAGRLEPRRAGPPALDGATDGGARRAHVTDPPVELARPPSRVPATRPTPTPRRTAPTTA